MGALPRGGSSVGGFGSLPGLSCWASARGPPRRMATRSARTVVFIRSLPTRLSLWTKKGLRIPVPSPCRILISTNRERSAAVIRYSNSEEYAVDVVHSAHPDAGPGGPRPRADRAPSFRRCGSAESGHARPEEAGQGGRPPTRDRGSGSGPGSRLPRPLRPQCHRLPRAHPVPLLGGLSGGRGSVDGRRGPRGCRAPVPGRRQAGRGGGRSPRRRPSVDRTGRRPGLAVDRPARGRAHDREAISPDGGGLRSPGPPGRRPGGPPVSGDGDRDEPGGGAAGGRLLWTALAGGRSDRPRLPGGDRGSPRRSGGEGVPTLSGGAQAPEAAARHPRLGPAGSPEHAAAPPELRGGCLRRRPLRRAPGDRGSGGPRSVRDGPEGPGRRVPPRPDVGDRGGGKTPRGTRRSPAPGAALGPEPGAPMRVMPRARDAGGRRGHSRDAPPLHSRRRLRPAGRGGRSSPLRRGPRGARTDEGDRRKAAGPPPPRRRTLGGPGGERGGASPGRAPDPRRAGSPADRGAPGAHAHWSGGRPAEGAPPPRRSEPAGAIHRDAGAGGAGRGRPRPAALGIPRGGGPQREVSRGDGAVGAGRSVVRGEDRAAGPGRS